MNISSESMTRLAALSRLELSQAELEQLAGELETVVKYMDILSRLPPETTEGVQPGPLAHNVFRPDRILCSHDRAELLSNAPEANGETLAVPKAVD